MENGLSRTKTCKKDHGQKASKLHIFIAKPGLTRNKLMINVWWDRIIHYEFFPPGKTINWDLYCQQLMRLKQTEEKKQSESICRKDVENIVRKYDSARIEEDLHLCRVKPARNDGLSQPIMQACADYLLRNLVAHFLFHDSTPYSSSPAFPSSAIPPLRLIFYSYPRGQQGTKQVLFLNDLDISGIPETKGGNTMHNDTLIGSKPGVSLDGSDIVSEVRIGTPRDYASIATGKAVAGTGEVATITGASMGTGGLGARLLVVRLLQRA
ncbi:hypothetical protein EVAR_61046_1 [Eumeta japonica]|uniref:Uncharacterized protein n=1 Tax=Eumeta variegata TaxID=151549 RepID=A0A4C1Z0G0_EUMVA|nr:hypothetical protein EVAR_61046_1 [Eumeta japonica]